MSRVINRFSGKHYFLSNMYMHEIVYKGVTYPSSEHAYQSAKATNIEDHDFVRSSFSSTLSKTRARKIKTRDDWDEIKYDIMKEILYIKFEDKELKKKLIDTDGIKLIEGNNWHDNYWGDCSCFKCRNNKGQNMLGKILMEIRKEKINKTVLF
jgi:ribA/ribD-fused uncharacterized protein